MADILFVTWDGGGNVPPALAIARRMQARGHTVRFLGHAAQADRLRAAGSASRRASTLGASPRRNRTRRSR